MSGVDLSDFTLVPSLPRIELCQSLVREIGILKQPMTPKLPPIPPPMPAEAAASQPPLKSVEIAALPSRPGMAALA